LKNRSFNIANILLLLFCFGLNAQNKTGNGFLKTKTGLQYKLFAKGGTQKPLEGDLMTLHLSYTTEKDSVLFDSKKQDGPVEMVLNKPSFKGGPEEGMMMMSMGDSLLMRLPVDSIFLKTFKTVLPKYLKKGSYLTFKIVLLQILEKEKVAEMLAEREKKYQSSNFARKNDEASNIEKFMMVNDFKVDPFPSGLYFVILKDGNGYSPARENIVKIKYFSTLIDGTNIEGSLENPIVKEFRIGDTKLLKGFEEGLLMMRKGGHYSLILPSALAYGDKTHGNLPPYTTLIYDVELIESK
jgi:FKBP-type peptidyl-prolyl cis-trans isomerase FkpA